MNIKEDKQLNDDIKRQNSIDNFVEGVLDVKDDSEYEDQVHMFIKNMDEEYVKDLENGLGFLITDRNGLEKNKTQRTENGIYSKEYGSIWQDENAFQEMYSCDCGKMQGRFYEGMHCSNCDSDVVFRDKNINKTGYFVLDNYVVIHPTLFNFVESLIGTTKLKTILDATKWKTDTNGKSHRPEIIEDTKNVNKYDNIGYVEFINRFYEILEFFYNKKKKEKAKVYEFLMENKDNMFTHCLPVISLILRPIIIGEEDFNFAKINKPYEMLSTKIYDLNLSLANLTEENAKDVNQKLAEVQYKYDDVVSMLTESMNKKNGLIRNNIQGSRYNFSGRGVIIPMKGGKTNEIDFPYLTFLHLYKPEIIHYICKLNYVTVDEANTIWNKALVKFNKKVYSIMEYLVEHFDLHILLNRNPIV